MTILSPACQFEELTVRNSQSPTTVTNLGI